MNYLLDSDTFSAATQGNSVVSRLFSQNVGNICLSVVTVTDVEMGLMQAMTPLRYTQAYFALRQQVRFLDVTEPIAHRSAILGNDFRRQGKQVDLEDLLITATALVHNLTLITHNALLTGVAGLSVADWSVPRLPRPF
jgi:tRNA(fMet)-specific endonuclease VapC